MAQGTHEKKDSDPDIVRIRTTSGFKKRFKTFVAEHGFPNSEAALVNLLNMAKEKKPEEIVKVRTSL